MSTVIHSKAFKLHQIKCINYCRLYLGVTALSDIALADGKTVDPHMRSGNISQLSSSANQLSTKQGHPNWKSWNTWGKCLKLFANGDQLKVLLRQWFVLITDLQRNWPLYLDYTEDTLYVWPADRFCQYSPSAQDSHVFTSSSDTE
eukprot:9895915-Ditylum_brightwellii.AAC.1